MNEAHITELGLESFRRFLNKYSRVERMAFDFAGHRLHPVEVHTLVFIADKGRSYASEISRGTGVTRGAVSQVVGKLEKKGLLEREKDESNALRVLLKPSPKGLEVAQAHTAFHLSQDKEFFSFLSALDAEQKRLIKELFEEMDCWMDKYFVDP
ncbi:MarR family winged helix-turn-helix transcriptional regulator [Desulfobaculum bizertense]|uniref:DNA-binding transcriptional regulator, MarR family n=1 Tax=Desulfobaculum bizertense DSM 18034 TaxID=1121442 RepID=A0A1T4VZ27_9BACT|nr:MarR family winged helix-turn-helix transcriptional regulator [Desulfobaculum bizertense]SKA70149.1 DNA-binding transcriptional regulator, MarR family [Desulfobaculum bizertense DSM 18034]